MPGFGAPKAVGHNLSLQAAHRFDRSSVHREDNNRRTFSFLILESDRLVRIQILVSLPYWLGTSSQSLNVFGP